jgi:hypothetical protein
MAKTLLAGAGLAAALAIAASDAAAGVYTDDLGRCLIGSTTEADKTLMVQWIFSALSASSAVSPMTTLTADQRQDFNRRAAHLYQRLMLETCRRETMEALRYEGQGALETSFGLLGQVAARGLMTDPKATAELESLSDYVDKGKFEAFAREAGLPVSNPPGSSAAGR